jgi:hypothetical protein
MSLDSALLELMTDTVTIEPFVSMTGNQAHTYGSAVTYQAQVLPFSTRIINQQGREVESTASVIIPGRIAVDHRSRITLPSGFSPQHPPIQRVEPAAGLGLDHTRIWL